MAITKAQEIRVGIASIIAIVILVAGIIWGKGGGIGVDNRNVTMVFPNAAGLDVGAPITFNGVRKGSVSSIEALTYGARVTAVVERSVPLKDDAGAILAPQELTGGKKIELTAGQSSIALAENDTIRGTVQGDLTAVLAQVSEIGESAKVTLARVDSAISAVVGIVGTPEFRYGVQNTLANLQEGSAVARDIAVQNRALINRLLANVDGTVDELRTMVREMKPSVDRLMVSADSLSIDGRQLVRKLNGTLERADSLVVNIDGIATDLRTGKGLAGKLIYDPVFAAQVDSTLRAVRLLIRNIDRRGVNLNIGFGGKE